MSQGNDFQEIFDQHFVYAPNECVKIGIFAEWLDNIFGYGLEARAHKKQFRIWLKSRYAGINPQSYKKLVDGVFQKHCRGIKLKKP